MGERCEREGMRERSQREIGGRNERDMRERLMRVRDEREMTEM